MCQKRVQVKNKNWNRHWIPFTWIRHLPLADSSLDLSISSFTKLKGQVAIFSNSSIRCSLRTSNQLFPHIYLCRAKSKERCSLVKRNMIRSKTTESLLQVASLEARTWSLRWTNLSWKTILLRLKIYLVGENLIIILCFGSGLTLIWSGAGKLKLGTINVIIGSFNCSEKPMSLGRLKL